MALLTFNYDKVLGCYVSDMVTLTKGGILASLTFGSPPGGYIEIQRKVESEWKRMVSSFASGSKFMLSGNGEKGEIVRVVSGKKPIESNWEDVTPESGGGAGCDCIIRSVNSDFDVSSEGELSLYKAISIGSFTGGSVNEIGTSIEKINLAWSLNKTPSALSIDGSSISVNLKSKTVSGPFTKDKTFTLKATDSRGSSKSATTTLSFLNRKYYGVLQKNELENADVLSLANKPLSSDRKLSETEFDCTGGKYPWFCIPASFGTPSFKVGGLPNSDFVSQQLSVTNASGYTEDYVLWRTATIQTGKLLISVS